MTKFVFIFCLVLSSMAFASAYKAGSLLPEELKPAVLEFITTHCDLIYPSSLNEIETTVREETVQGVTDNFYTTVFSAQYLFDGTIPSQLKLRLKVLSVKLRVVKNGMLLVRNQRQVVSKRYQ